jgi:Flp pilus assembly protein TadD
VLGRWHRIASDVGSVRRALASVAYESLPPASIDEGIKCLERAVALNPNRLMHHIELGIAYAQAGRKDDARRSLAKGLGMPSREKDDAGSKESGRAVLDSLN